MNKLSVLELGNPVLDDPLTEILQAGARKLLAQAIDAEVEAFLASYEHLKDQNGRARIVRNGYLPERDIQTGIGPVTVKKPRVRDRARSNDQRIRFTSSVLPSYLRRSKSIEELIPWLYLKGVSTGDFKEALQALLGTNAPGLSASTITRLKQVWHEEYQAWRQRDLSSSQIVYLWVDGAYFGARLEETKNCILIVMGATSDGKKELLAVSDGYRESEASWLEVLEQLTHQGLTVPPKLAIGDGALGFWKAVTKHWPTTAQQRCWVHKTANVLNKLPKAMQPKVKEALQDIWMAEGRDAANGAFDNCVKRFEDKYPGAMNCLIKDREQMLAFYDFPAPHWQHIRTTNPIESVFATVRLRTDKVKNCGSRKTTLTMAWKLMTTAQQRWQRLRGHKLLADVIEGVQFKDGKLVEKDQEQASG